MAEQTCIFCKIMSREIPAKIIDENGDCIVIQDIAPKAPIHYLIIPKKHIKNIQALSKEDAHLIGEVALMAQKINSEHNNAGSFRLVTNNGAQAGQSVFHIHFHFLAGKSMTDL